MLLHYHKHIVALLIGVLAWLPFAGLHAQVVDVSMVKNSAATIVQASTMCDKLTKHDSMDHCASNHTTKMNMNCASDGEACQCYTSCCGVSMYFSLQYTSRIYVADGYLGVKKSPSIPLLILPTEIKPPRKLV